MGQTRVLAIQGSPRRNGNSERLLDVFTEEFGLRSHDAEIEKMALRADIAPCLGCDKCVSGHCVQNDSMLEVYGKIRSADVIVLAAPVYFYGFPSHVKAMIDRCQLFYNVKYRRMERWRKAQGVGVLLACGATNGDNLSAGLSACARYWFDAIDFGFAGKVFVRGVDGPGEIRGCPEALEEARELAAKLGCNDAQRRSQVWKKRTQEE